MIVPTINQRRIARSRARTRGRGITRVHQPRCMSSRAPQSHACSIGIRQPGLERSKTSVTETSSPPLPIPESLHGDTRPDLWSSSYREFSGRRWRGTTKTPRRAKSGRGDLNPSSACKFIRRENTHSTIEKSPRRVMGALAWSVHPVTSKRRNLATFRYKQVVFLRHRVYIFHKLLCNIRINLFVKEKKTREYVY